MRAPLISFNSDEATIYLGWSSTKAKAEEVVFTAP